MNNRSHDNYDNNRALLEKKSVKKSESRKFPIKGETNL